MALRLGLGLGLQPDSIVAAGGGGPSVTEGVGSASGVGQAFAEGNSLVAGAWSTTFKNASFSTSSSDSVAAVVAGAGNRGILGNAPMVQDAIYFEMVVNSLGANLIAGVAVQGFRTNVFAFAANMGVGWNSNGTSAAPLNVTYTAGDRLGFAWKRSVAGLWCRKNGTWLGNDPSGAAAVTLTNGIDKVLVPLLMSSSNCNVTLVTVESLFGHAKPTGFSTLIIEDYPGYRWSSTDKGANLTLSETQTKATKSSTGHHNVRLGTEPCKKKQVFCVEVTADGAGTTAKSIGIMDFDDSLTVLMGGNGFSIGYRSGGTVVRNSATLQTYTAWGAVGDKIMIATDGDANALWFGLNGTWNGDPGAGTGAVGQWVTDGAHNYGIVACGSTDAGDAFKLIDWPYTVPTGFVAPNAA